VDDAGVYWRQASPSGSTPVRERLHRHPTRVSNAAIYSRSIVLDDRNAYWTDPLAWPFGPRRSGGDGGAATLWESDARPFDIATDGQRIYVTVGDGRLYVLGVDGGAVTTLGVAERVSRRCCSR